MTTPAAVRTVLVVDDHRIFAQMLAASLDTEPDLRTVATAHEARSAVELATFHRPDLVVTDARLGDGDGVALARRLVDELPAAVVVVLTAFADAGLVERAARAGASAVLAKDGDLPGLLAVLRSARRGTFEVGPGLDSPAPSVEDRLAALGLTPQDGALLRLLAAGMDTEGLAHELDVSPQQARAHVDRIADVLGVRGAADVVAEAVGQGLVRIGRG